MAPERSYLQRLSQDFELMIIMLILRVALPFPGTGRNPACRREQIEDGGGCGVFRIDLLMCDSTMERVPFLLRRIGRIEFGVALGPLAR